MSKFNDIQEDKISFRLGYRQKKKKKDNFSICWCDRLLVASKKRVILKIGSNENEKELIMIF